MKFAFWCEIKLNIGFKIKREKSYVAVRLKTINLRILQKEIIRKINNR